MVVRNSASSPFLLDGGFTSLLSPAHIDAERSNATSPSGKGSHDTWLNEADSTPELTGQVDELMENLHM